MNLENSRKKIGRLVGLWRYPVKSMGCEPLQQVDVSWFGLAGDRRWAFVRPHAVKSGFPWFTIRENDRMNQFKPFFEDPSNANKSKTWVKTPSGKTLEVNDPALSLELDPNGPRLIKQNRGIFDTFPLSLITTQTLASLSQSTGVSLDPQRFRPNFLVEAFDDAAYPEDGWVGQILTIGAMRFRVDSKDGRCVIITVDPITSEKNPHILKTVAQERQGCLGVYGSVVMPGMVKLGEDVFLEAC